MLRIGARLTLILVSLALPLLLCEGALRLFGPVLPGNYNTGSFLTQHAVYGRFHVPSFDGWVKTSEFTARVTINSLGLRGPERPYEKPPGVRRILVLGDSFTEAAQVNADEGVVGRLESALNRRNSERYEVLNGGIGGWGTGQQLVYLREEGYRYGPDLALVLLYVGNDIFDNSYALQGRPSTPREPYFVFGQDGSFEPMPFRPRRTEDVSPAVQFLREQTLIWNVFETGVLAKLSEDPDDAELRANRFNMNKMIIHSVRSSERQDDAWKTTLALLRRVHQFGEERGFKTAVVVAPAAYQVYAADWDSLLSENKLKPEQWSADLPNAVLNVNAQAIGAPMLDLLPAMRATATTGPRLYFPYDKHWTAAAHAVAASEIERFLVRQELVR